MTDSMVCNTQDLYHGFLCCLRPSPHVSQSNIFKVNAWDMTDSMVCNTQGFYTAGGIPYRWDILLKHKYVSEGHQLFHCIRLARQVRDMEHG